MKTRHNKHNSEPYQRPQKLLLLSIFNIPKVISENYGSEQYNQINYIVKIHFYHTEIQLNSKQKQTVNTFDMNDFFSIKRFVNALTMFTVKIKRVLIRISSLNRNYETSYGNVTWLYFEVRRNTCIKGNVKRNGFLMGFSV